MLNKKENLVLTLENSLNDFVQKGNLDLALEYYNPNGFFEKVYIFTYEPKDLLIQHNLDWLIVKSPSYFSFLKKMKKNKLSFLIFSPFVFLFHVFYLSAYIKIKKIKVARSGHPYLMSLSLLLASKVNNIPFIPTIGGDNRLAQSKIGRYHIFNNKYLSYLVEEFVLNRSSNVITPNQYSSNYVRSISNVSDISVIPLPLRTQIFDNLCLGNNMKAPTFFLFIGRLVGDKHPDFVIELYIEYIKTNPSSILDLYIIGGGELEASLKKRVEEANLSERVFFIGFLNTNDIVKYLNQNPICLIPISGFVIYEAAVFGNIIVTSDIEWHKEFINDNENGWVGKYLDLNDWMIKLKIITNDIETSTKKASGLRKKMKDLSPEKIYNKQVDVYKKVLHDNQ